jgi:uncharacterized membrane protein
METNMQNPTPGPVSTPPGQAPQNNMAMGILAYLGILVVIPFLTGSHKDPFVKFHLKQGLVLLIVEIIASVIAGLPALGGMLSSLIWLGSVILSILGIVNVVNNQEKELPVVGAFAKNFNF